MYKLTDEIAIVNTVDFITPPVDDPYWFGQIAAANSLSDIYSMGGRPLVALNVVMFPSESLGIDVLKEILRGSQAKVEEAGACLAGGHSVDDEEPKYGLCVTGVVHPDRIISNAGSQLGDVLILTKPLGTGVLFNAVRSGKLTFKVLEKSVLPSIAVLNGPVMDAALGFDLHACTDVTGFGIVGHSFEMSNACGLGVVLTYSDLRFYPDALDMYKKGETTRSNRANRAMTKDYLDIRVSLSKHEEELLFDPQTSGGLLLSVPRSQAEEVMKALADAGVQSAVRIGEVVEGPVGVTVV